MNTRTVSAMFPAMLAIATAMAQSPVPQSAQPVTQTHIQTPAQPPTQAALDVADLLKSAHAAYRKGDYNAARASLEQAWSALQPSPRSEPKRYDVAKQLAIVLSAAGDYKTAQEYLQLAIDWREANHVDPDDSKLIGDWIDMANLCQRQKDFERALALLQFVQARHARYSGPQSLLVADDLSRIALLHVTEEKPALAIEPLQQAIGIRETVLGAEHPAILSELDRLGSIQIALRLYADAEDTFRRALVIRERLTGPTHADLIASVEGLAYAQFGQKKYDEAEQGYKRLLALWILAAGTPDYPMIALTLDKIAVFYREQKRWDEAEDAAGKAIAIRGLFLANGLNKEALQHLLHDDKPGAVAMLQRGLDVLDESRPEHAELRSQLQAALKELAPQKPVKPAAPKSTKSTGTKATTTATTTKPQ